VKLLAFLRPGPTSALQCILSYARQAPGMPNSKTKWNFKHPTPDQFYLVDIPSGVCVAPRRIQAAILPQRPVNQIKTTTSRGVQTTSLRPQLLEPPRELRCRPHLSLPLLTNRQTIAIYGKGVGGARPVPVLPRTDEL